MKRKPKNVEFLETLRTLSGFEKVVDFSKACGKATPNMVNRLAGNPVPGKKFLRSCLENLYGWDADPLMELKPIPGNLNSLPQKPGVYIIYDSGAKVL